MPFHKRPPQNVKNGGDPGAKSLPMQLHYLGPDPNHYATDTWVTLVHEPDKGAAKHFLPKRQGSSTSDRTTQLTFPKPNRPALTTPKVAETSPNFASPKLFNNLHCDYGPEFEETTGPTE